MSRLLFCWELGANFGHLSLIASLREQLQAAGHDLSFAVADLRTAQEILGPTARLFQAPVWPKHKHQGSTVHVASFADVLTSVGFADPSKLGVMVDAWSALFGVVGPELVIADHSPAAQLAARIGGIPIITLGTGFTQPPLHLDHFPPLRTDVAPALPEAALLTSAHKVLSIRGHGRSYAALPELFVPNDRIIVGLPELDPYRSFRREMLSAPPGGFGQPRVVEGRRLFAYLGEEAPALEGRVQALCDLDFPVEIYIRGGGELLRNFIRLRGKIAFAEPPRIAAVLSRSSHVLSQGGAMLASEALAAGRPHFFIPLHAEAQMNASAVVRAGYGREYSREVATSAAFREEIRSFVYDHDLKQRTMNYGQMLADRSLPDSGAQLLDMIARWSEPPAHLSGAFAPAAAPAS